MGKNVNISISADNRQAISQTNQMTNTLISLNKIVNNAQVSLHNSDKAWSTYLQGLNSGLEILKKVGNTAKSAFDFLREGADYAEAEQNFKAYTQSIGKEAESMMAVFRKASKNQLSDIELMKSATNALKKASISDIDAIAKLYEIADAKGDVLGMSLQETFDKMVSAITQGNGRALIELGLLPEKFNRASDAAGLLQNRALLLQEVLKKGSEDIVALGSVGDTASDSFNQLEAASLNFNTEFKKALSEAVVPLINYLKTDGIPTAKSALGYLKEGIELAIAAEKNFALLSVAAIGLASASVVSSFGKVSAGIKLITAEAGTATVAVTSLGTAMTTAFTAGTALVAYLAYIKKGEWDAENLEKTNYQSLYESENPASVSRAKIYKLEQELSQFNSLDALEKQKSDLENKLIKAQSALKNARSGYELGAFQKEVTQYNAELEALNAKIEKIEAIKKALSDEKDTLEVINKQQKALVEAGEANVETATEIAGIDDNRVKIVEKLVKSYANLDTQFKPLLANESEAYKLLENMVYAAGGLGVNLKNGTTEAGKLADKLSKVDNSIIKALSGKEYTSADFATGAMDFMTGGLFTAKSSKSADRTIKKTADKINSEFKDAISSSISEGFARADFSAFAESLGSGIKSVVGGALGDTINSLFNKNNMGSLTSGSGLFKQIYTKNSSGNTSLNWAALASNVGIGLGLSFLTSDGGLLGKRKIVGAENINKSAELNAQVDQAKTLRDEMFLALGVSEYTRQLLDEAEFAYTWVTSSKSGSLFNRKKSYTIHNQEAAQSSVKYLEELQAKALDEQAQRSFATFNLGRSDSIQAAAANFTDAQSAYNASQTLLYGGKTKSQIESEISAKNKEATNNYNLYAQFANLSNQFGGNIGSRYKAISNQYFQAYQNISSEITKLVTALDNPTYKYSLAERTQMQQQLEEAKIALSEAKQTARTGLTSSLLGSATLASLIPQNSGLMNMLLGNSDVANNSSMIKTMLPLLEKAGFQDFDLTKAFADAGNDPQKMLEAYTAQQSILQSASSVYEQLYKDAKAESLNSSLTVEEQMAAFERFQDSFNAFLEIQNQILTNTQTIADIEKQNFSKSLTTDLSDALSVFAETVMQTNGSKTEVYYQTLSASELLAKLKNILKENKTANADALIGAINELEELETWGD